MVKKKVHKKLIIKKKASKKIKQGKNKGRSPSNKSKASKVKKLIKLAKKKR